MEVKRELGNVMNSQFFVCEFKVHWSNERGLGSFEISLRIKELAVFIIKSHLFKFGLRDI